MPDFPFTTDGCSGGMSWIWRKVLYPLRLVATPLPPCEGDCIGHDGKYHPGGTALERLEADVDLILKVARRGGSPALARAKFMGISIFGHPLLPLPWRWGFGWKWPRRYDKAGK